jgi:uncharacterized RDD family membrane protein YckC
MKNKIVEYNLSTRLLSAIIDHFVMTLLFLFFLIPEILNRVSGLHIYKNVGFLSHLSFLGLSLYFCKDCIDGRSIGKRITRLQVIDDKSKQPASPLQCFFRNIFCILWPMEIILIIINPSRRIGDFVARTKVVAYNQNFDQHIKKWQVFSSVLLSYFFVLLIFFCLKQLIIPKNAVHYIKSSYNDRESKILQRLLTDSENNNIIVEDAEVYDSIERKNLKYIFITLQLKQNYFEKKDSLFQLEEKISSLTFSLFPLKTFKGQTVYFFNNNENKTIDTVINTEVRN